MPTQQQTLTKFWAVYSPEGGVPTFKHETYESAVTEARRLSNKYYERTFYILKTLEAFKTKFEQEHINL